MSSYQSGYPEEILVEYLYLDLDTCSRCQSTLLVLEEVLEELKFPFASMGLRFQLKKINVVNEDLAERHRFLTSPTIRLNGQDILPEAIENYCPECSQISGTSTTCRMYVYRNRQYSDPPKGLIMEAVLRTVFGDRKTKTCAPYRLPENLKNFYSKGQSVPEINREKGNDEMKSIVIYEPAMCCPTGVCGPGVDKELIRITGLAEELNRNGIRLMRYNLTDHPMEFAGRQELNDLLAEKGIEILPVTIAEEKIVLSGRYPTNEEIEDLLGLNLSAVSGDTVAGNDSCGCSGGCC